MKRKILIIILLFLTLGCKENGKQTSIEPKSQKEILTYENYNPNEYRKITELDKYKEFFTIVGMVLEGTDKAISFIQKDSLHVLVLEQIIRNNPSKVNFKILDEVQLIADNSELFSEPANCVLTDEIGEEFIFGIAKKQDKEYFDNDQVLKVWKVDLTEGRFKEVEPKSVKCINHFYDHEE